MITPAEIRAKAVSAYRRMLDAWLRDEQLGDFFPLPLRVRLSPIENDIPATIAAVEALRARSKLARGWGYTIHWEERRSRDFGHNRFPTRITIDTLQDLLRLAGRVQEFTDTCRVVDRLRDEFPSLSGWLSNNIRTVHRLAGPLNGLVEVTRFFLNNPWPDCYARQMPAAVDTKFVMRHEALLRAWLDTLLPASAIQVGETKFALRFGLRDGQPHTMVRVLDHELRNELHLPFDEFSVPLRILETIAVRDATVFIVENQLNLLTLPSFHRGIAFHGQGDAAIALAKLTWLGQNRIVYWGDVDIEGFHILSRLRGLLPAGDVRSIMMDTATLRSNADSIVAGNAPSLPEPPRLVDAERAAYSKCAELLERLEQEKISQAYVDQQLRAIEASGMATTVWALPK